VAKYLSSIMKILPVVQARQIADLLHELRAKGELRDTVDYQNALSELTGLVNAEDPKPTLERIGAMVWGLCRSDSHNAMMRAAKNDLEAVFLQTDEIGRRLDDQHKYMMKSLIADLEKVLQEQEDKIRELKIKNARDNEFDGAQLNSFAQTTLRQMTRPQCETDLFFFDNRTGQAKDSDELPDTYVSEHGNKLVLSSLNEPKILPVSAKLLFEEDSFETEVDATVNNNLSNVIDGKKNTFWSREVYLSEPADRVSTTMEFDLGTGRDVNYCIIEGATGFPFYVSEMHGVGVDGQTIDLLLRRSKTANDLIDQEYLPDENTEVEINGHERIDFFQVFVKSIRIKFTYSSLQEADFYVSDEVSANSALDEIKSPQDVDLSDLSPVVRGTLVSKELEEICGIPEESSQHINSSVYRFCLDNVWFGNSLYNDKGIFVSEAVHLSAPGVVSIKAQEKNVGFYIEDSEGTIRTSIEENDLSETVLSSEQYKNAGSVEYEMIRHYTDSEGNPRREHFPIPILGQEKVVRERVILTKRIDDPLANDAGALRFAPRVGRGNDVHVFRNGREIACGTGPDGWHFATRKDSGGNFDWKNNIASDDYSDFRRWNLSPRKMWLKFNSVSPGDIFTVSYTIRTSVREDMDLIDPPYSTPLTNTEAKVYMDDNKMLYLGEDGKIVFVPDPQTQQTMESDLYVQVTLRRNSPQFALSPEAIEYMLLSAPYKPGLEEKNSD